MKPTIKARGGEADEGVHPWDEESPSSRSLPVALMSPVRGETTRTTRSNPARPCKEKDSPVRFASTNWLRLKGVDVYPQTDKYGTTHTAIAVPYAIRSSVFAPIPTRARVSFSLGTSLVMSAASPGYHINSGRKLPHCLGASG